LFESSKSDDGLSILLNGIENSTANEVAYDESTEDDGGDELLRILNLEDGESSDDGGDELLRILNAYDHDDDQNLKEDDNNEGYIKIRIPQIIKNGCKSSPKYRYELINDASKQNLAEAKTGRMEENVDLKDMDHLYTNDNLDINLKKSIAADGKKRKYI
jgi:hypothetical protein